MREKESLTLFHGGSLLRSVIKTLWPKGELAYDTYVSFANRLVLDHGSTTAIGILKDINSRVRNTIAERPKLVKDYSFNGKWLRVDKRNLPVALKPLWVELKDRPRLVLFIVNLVYTLRCKPNLDVSTLELPVKSSAWLTWAEDYTSFVKSSMFKDKLTTGEPKRLHFTLKSGPLGPGSIVQAGLEIALFSKLGLIDWFKGICDKVGQVNLGLRFIGFYQYAKILGRLDNIVTNNASVKAAKGLAKLAFLANPAGKTRIVFILSWWLQQLLYPLHVSMMDWLRLQPQDATFNQSGALKDMIQWTSLGDQDIYCFDLTAATDRWPRHHQIIALRAMFGDEWADTWLEIMEIKPYATDLKRFVTYSVGQPMGAYASWATLAVVHHSLLRYAAFKVGINNPVYWVLGDDVLIKNSKLATKYMELLQQLGVDISVKKSIIPRDNSASSAEFAKHLVVAGIDYTPASPNLFLEVCDQHQWWKLSELLIDIKRHYGLDIISFDNDRFTSSQILETILSRFSQTQKEKALVALTNPETGFPHLVKIDPRTFKDPHKLDLPDCGETFEGTIVKWTGEAPSPWGGLTELEFLYYKSELVEAAMQKALQSQYRLREGLSTLSLNCSEDSDDLLLNLPHHPLWSVMESLEEVIHAGEYQLAHGVAPDNFDESCVSALVDANQLHRWLVLNKTKDVTTYNRETYHKEKRLRIVELWTSSRPESASAVAEYDDWT